MLLWTMKIMSAEIVEPNQLQFLLLDGWLLRFSLASTFDSVFFRVKHGSTDRFLTFSSSGAIAYNSILTDEAAKDG